jgi:hypothetical protein
MKYTYEIHNDRYNPGDLLVEFIYGKKSNVWALDDLFNLKEIPRTKRYEATERAKEYIRKNYPELLI